MQLYNNLSQHATLSKNSLSSSPAEVDRRPYDTHGDAQVTCLVGCLSFMLLNGSGVRYVKLRKTKDILPNYSIELHNNKHKWDKSGYMHKCEGMGSLAFFWPKIYRNNNICLSTRVWRNVVQSESWTGTLWFIGPSGVVISTLGSSANIASTSYSDDHSVETRLAFCLVIHDKSDNFIYSF